MLGVLPNGTREVLGVVNHPSEGALNWKYGLIALRERGVEQIDLIVSDALMGIETAVAEAFFDGKGSLGEKPNLLCKIAASFQGLGCSQREQKTISKGKVMTRNSILGYYPYTLFQTLP